MIWMAQIIDIIAKENVCYKRDELEFYLTKKRLCTHRQQDSRLFESSISCGSFDGILWLSEMWLTDRQIDGQAQNKDWCSYL